MSDDLVKRLRYGIVEHRKRWSGDTHADLGGSVDYDATTDMLHEAADRIEELEADLQDAHRVGAEWFEQSKQNHKRATTAEAKLAKAMEALDDDRVYGVITHTSLATLAELKGETDE